MSPPDVPKLDNLDPEQLRYIERLRADLNMSNSIIATNLSSHNTPHETYIPPSIQFAGSQQIYGHPNFHPMYSGVYQNLQPYYQPNNLTYSMAPMAAVMPQNVQPYFQHTYAPSRAPPTWNPHYSSVVDVVPPHHLGQDIMQCQSYQQPPQFVGNSMSTLGQSVLDSIHNESAPGPAMRIPQAPHPFFKCIPAQMRVGTIDIESRGTPTPMIDPAAEAPHQSATEIPAADEHETRRKRRRIQRSHTSVTEPETVRAEIEVVVRKGQQAAQQGTTGLPRSVSDISLAMGAATNNRDPGTKSGNPLNARGAGSIPDTDEPTFFREGDESRPMPRDAETYDDPATSDFDAPLKAPKKKIGDIVPSGKLPKADKRCALFRPTAYMGKRAQFNRSRSTVGIGAYRTGIHYRFASGKIHACIHNKYDNSLQNMFRKAGKHDSAAKEWGLTGGRLSTSRYWHHYSYDDFINLLVKEDVVERLKSWITAIDEVKSSWTFIIDDALFNGTDSISCGHSRCVQTWDPGFFYYEDCPAEDDPYPDYVEKMVVHSSVHSEQCVLPEQWLACPSCWERNDRRIFFTKAAFAKHMHQEHSRV